MRNLFLVLFYSATLSLGAQIERGDMLISLANYFPATQFDLAAVPPPAAYGTGLRYDAELGNTSLYYGGEYGYAVLDRLMLGIAIAGIHPLEANGWKSTLLQPRLRYYAVNRPGLMVFGQVGTSVVRVDPNQQYLGSWQLTAGLHHPLTGGVLLSPQLSYNFDSGPNSVVVGVTLDVRVGRSEAEDLEAGIRRGRVMLGAQSARISVRERATVAGLELGGHYFLADRFAVGGQLGYGGNFVELRTGNGTTASVHSTRLHLAASGRYYPSVGGRWAWFAEAGTGLMRSSVTSDILVNVDAETQAFLLLGGGLQYFTSEQFSLEAAPAVRYDFSREAWLYGLNLGVRYLL